MHINHKIPLIIVYDHNLYDCYFKVCFVIAIDKDVFWSISCPTQVNGSGGVKNFFSLDYIDLDQKSIDLTSTTSGEQQLEVLCMKLTMVPL